MKELITKIKSYLSLLKKKEGSYQKPGVNPSKDWWIILGVSSILIIFSGAYSYYLYEKIETGRFVDQNPSQNGAETRLNVLLLDHVSADLDDRSADFDKIKDSTIPPDPSI